MTSILHFQEESPGRNKRIDLLRGVAILCVLLLHYALAYGWKKHPLAALVDGALLRAVYHGNFGVTLFFVVSGYLITHLSLARWGSLSRIALRDFYLLRAARLLPALLLALGLIVTLGCLDLPFFDNRDGGHALPASYFIPAVLSVLTFWHNLLMQSEGYFNYCLNIYWSLSVEEAFYLLLPLAGWLLRRTRLLVLVCLLLIVIGPIYRTVHAHDELFFMYGYLACFDAIAMGCLVGLLAQRLGLSGRSAAGLRLLAALAFVALYLRGFAGWEGVSFSLVALCAAVYLLASVNDPAPGWGTGRLTAPLRWLGRHSYELYLFHIIVLGLQRNLLSREQLDSLGWSLWALLFLGGSALLAWLVARFVSLPANDALRRRYLPPGAGAARLMPAGTAR
ncbi:acyltransferase family protein [Chitinimonas lacunae]|uniref:Acyltransferase family protein n=1 Tax=Chitinimonas lacunae TaxID=1963018 RepID=A0ABV8MSJ8_9NEIS